MNIVVGIDLAIRQSGVCIVGYEGIHYEILHFGLIVNEKWQDDDKYYNQLIKNWTYAVDKVKLTFKQNNIEKKELTLVIELSNFSNPLNTQRMSFIAGIIIGCIKMEWPNAEVKITNANGWFHWFNRDYVHEKNWTKLPREKRKELAIKEYKRALKEEFKFENDSAHKFYENLNESEKSDIADAYWLGVYYDKL